MDTIFETDISKFSSSLAAVRQVLTSYFGQANPVISRTENGKPYLQSPATGLFFSVSHTKEKLFLAFSQENVGIDAEWQNRKVDLPTLIKKFPLEERAEIHTSQDFLRHWTVKESAVKLLGGTLAQDLKKLSYIDGRLFYDALEIPVRITTKIIDGYIVSICGERDFSTVNTITL